MTFWNALFFGLVQGVTEFIPVSSSAHLSVLFNLFGITSAGYNSNMFSVFLHFGTVMAALAYYWKDFSEIFFQIFDFAAALQAGESNAAGGDKNYYGLRLLVMMFFAALPLVMLLPMSHSISTLYNSTLFIGVVLVLSGTVQYIAGQLKPGRKGIKTMTVSDAILIGLCQTVAAIPGMSRTGVVMTAGIAVGCRSDFSAKFAVMLSVPVMFFANIFRFAEALSSPFRFADLPLCLLGMTVAAVSGFFAIKVFNSAVKNARFNLFSYYSWVAGVIFIILTMIF